MKKYSRLEFGQAATGMTISTLAALGGFMADAHVSHQVSQDIVACREQAISTAAQSACVKDVEYWNGERVLFPVIGTLGLLGIGGFGLSGMRIAHKQAVASVNPTDINLSSSGQPWPDRENLK